MCNFCPFFLPVLLGSHSGRGSVLVHPANWEMQDLPVISEVRVVWWP